MALPTGPGDNPTPPKRPGGIPTGNPPQRPTQPAQRPGGLPPQRPAQPTQPAQPAQRPAQQPAHRPQPQQPAQRPVPAQPAQRPQSPRQPAPPSPVDDFVFEDDDAFSQMSQEEMAREDALETRAPREAPQEVQAEEFKQAKREVKASHTSTLNERLTPRDQSKDEFETEFIDEKDAKLKPFGQGGKTKKNLNVNDFDKRKNLANNRKIIQGIFIAGMIAIVGFGAYKTFVPQVTYTYDDIAIIAAQQMGQTGFPEERGEGFAKSFIETYTTIDNSVNMGNALQYFAGGGKINRGFSNGVAQSILVGPVRLDSRSISESTANYTFGVLVQTSNIADLETPPPAHWLAFSVNVIYFEDTDTFAIAEGSPSLIPFETTANSNAIPAEGLGIEVKDLDISSTLRGFMEAYQASDINNHSKLDQYVVPNPDPAVLSGFGGKIQFNSNVNDSVAFTVYTPTEGDFSILKVLVNSQWKVTDASGTLASNYSTQSVMTLEQQANGQYLVSKYAPYLLIPSEIEE